MLGSGRLEAMCTDGTKRLWYVCEDEMVVVRSRVTEDGGRWTEDLLSSPPSHVLRSGGLVFTTGHLRAPQKPFVPPDLRTTLRTTVP
jgi:hypothetical protein